jgi:hypothetical protein
MNIDETGQKKVPIEIHAGHANRSGLYGRDDAVLDNETSSNDLILKDNLRIVEYLSHDNLPPS